MIKSERGEVDLHGSVSELKADLCIVIKAVREDVLAEVYGAEEAEKEIERIVEDSKKNESDAKKEIEANVAEILKILFGGASVALAA